MTNFKSNFKKETTFIDFGVNKKKIFSLCSNIGVNKRRLPKQLKSTFSNKVKTKLKSVLFGKRLKRKVLKSILFCIKIKTYRGIRNKFSYPARGQRTHTNGKTKKKISFSRKSF